jgi:HlyD family secretion protein
MEKVLKKINLRNRWVLIGGGALLIIIVIFALSRGGPQPAEAGPATAEAAIADLTGSFTVNGHLEPLRDVQLAMPVTGIVSKVNVKVGEEVKKGAVLVQLDDTDQKAALEIAKLQLEQAKVNVAKAEFDLNTRLTWSPNASQVAGAQASLANAEADVKAAQSAYDLVQWMEGVSATQQSLNLEKATNAYNKAKADLEYVYGNKPTLNAQQLELNLQQLRLQEADLNVLQAESALNKTRLVAPFDGVITAVNVDVGESVSGVVAEMISTDTLQLVLDVDEIDVGTLKVGQDAIVLVDAWPDAPLTGQILSIAPNANANSNTGVVNYEAHVAINKAEVELRAGMSASATITTFEIKDVLIVPNAAIVPDRTTGKYYVNVVAEDGTTTKVEVVIGSRANGYTEIKSGLEEGDKVLIDELPPLIDLSQGPGG